MNAKLKTANENIAKTMQAKSANSKSTTAKPKATKPATPKPQAPVTYAKKTAAPKAPRKPVVKPESKPEHPTHPAEDAAAERHAYNVAANAQAQANAAAIGKALRKNRRAKTETQPITPTQAQAAIDAALALAADVTANVSADKPTPTVKADTSPSNQTGQQIVMRAGALKAAIKNVDRARGKNSALPVLSHILVETLDEEALRFTATNLDFTLWHLAQAKVLQRGRSCLPDLLGDLIAKVNDDLLVTLTTSAKTWKTRVEAGRLTFTVNGMDPNEFPQATAFNGKSIVIGADLTHDAVKEIAQRVVPFASTDDARPVLQGVYVSGIFPTESGKNATLTFVGADGFRLAVLERDATVHYDVDQQQLDGIGLIVPARVFAETLKVTTDDAKPIQFLFHLQLDKKGVLEHGMVQVEAHAGGLRMNLLEGNFPDFTQIVPNPIPQLPFLPLLAEPTVAALQRAALVSSTQTARLQVQPDQVLVSASGSDTGDVAEIVPALYDPDWKPADKYEIAFNAAFLSEALRAAAYGDGTKPVQLRVSEPSKPAFIGIPRYRHVLMPMHIGKDDKPQAKPEPKPEPQADTPKAETPKPQADGKASAPQAKANGQTPKPNTKPAATANGKSKTTVTPVKTPKQKPN